MCGFMKKYTTIAGMLHSTADLRKECNIKKVLSVPKRAIRRRLEWVALKGTHVWVSFHEWTDSVGNTVGDILVGVGNQSYVVQTVTLESPQHGCRAHRTCGRLKIKITSTRGC